ncbi:MAG: isoprenylcysteine carboxylmethyltransferase family protein [Aestuariibacter sp.]|nr:isoprenylcysteine carboxylmethyltransferase family protein [Aestuariibacter sp.]
MTISLLSFVPSGSRIPVLIGLAGLVLWALAERWLYAVKLRQGKGSSKDKGSFLLLSLVWYGAVIFSLSDAVRFRWSTIDPALSVVQFMGVPFVALGLIARVVARLTLGKEFSPVVQTTDSHKLVSTGIYQVIRHPAYLGTLCLLIGFPLCFGSISRSQSKLHRN